MLNILTLKIGNKYSSEDVNKLFLGILNNTSVPFNMICYTEDPTGLDERIKGVLIKEPTLYKLQWHKVKFHKKGFAGIKEGEECIILDLDLKILKNIDEILDFEIKENEFGVIYRWWSDRTHQCPINGGFQKFRSGKSNYIWETFKNNFSYWQEYYIEKGEAFGPVNGEQNFIHNHIELAGLKRKYLPKDWFAKSNLNLNKSYIQPLWQKNVRNTDFLTDPSIKIIHYSDG